jgi:hypothetical protein
MSYFGRVFLHGRKGKNFTFLLIFGTDIPINWKRFQEKEENKSIKEFPSV